MQHPRFITFEGIDGSGKTTQIQHFVRKLQQHNFSVLALREPGDTPISELIRSILLSPESYNLTPKTELLLFSCSRSQLVDTVIRPALENGDIVICDRYTDSTVAYQAFGRQIPLHIVQECNNIATEGLMPTLTFYIDVPLEIAKQRMAKNRKQTDRFESDKDDFYYRVQEGYEYLLQTEPHRIVRLDGTQPVHILEQQIWEIAQQKLPWLSAAIQRIER